MATNQPISSGPTTTVSQGISGVRIRSPLGLLAALLLSGGPYIIRVSNTVRKRSRDDDSLLPRSGHLTACLRCFRFRATKMDELDRMRGWARLGLHFPFASRGPTDTERVAKLHCLRGVRAMAGRMVARCSYPLVS